MHINSINLYNSRISYYGSRLGSAGNNKKDSLQNKKDIIQIPPYPRRYLPGYYQNYSANKTYDSFTKLRDKNYLLDTVRQLMDNSRHSKNGFAIGMFDMDNFKSINELLGYKTGDDFIIEISSAISDVAKKNSLHTYRFGGEEFVVVFDKNHSKQEQEDIAQDIINAISSNEFISSRSNDYIRSAHKKLNEYIALSSKVSELIPLKTRRDLLRDLQFNFDTKEARNDAYLQKLIKEVNFEIKQLYLKLITSRIDEEESMDTINKLKMARNNISADILLDEADEKALDEYLISVYDKTFEIHQIKKWIKDFSKNGGFSITGGIIHFDKNSISNKTPIDIINETGELLKQGKNNHKGRKYF